MELNIDLNKLSIEELKLIIKLADKKKEDLEETKIIKKKHLFIKQKQAKKGKYHKRTIEDRQKIKHILTTYQNQPKRLRKEIRKLRKEFKVKANTMGNIIGKVKKEFGLNSQDPETKEDNKDDANKYMMRKKPIIPGNAFNAGVTQNNDFPAIKGLNQQYITLLKGMVKNMIMQPGLKLAYESEGKILDLNLAEWGRFCEEFMIKSQEIARHYGVYNNFRFKERKLIYG
jgi:hypothetical protein